MTSLGLSTYFFKFFPSSLINDTSNFGVLCRMCWLSYKEFRYQKNLKRYKKTFSPHSSWKFLYILRATIFCDSQAMDQNKHSKYFVFLGFVVQNLQSIAVFIAFAKISCVCVKLCRACNQFYGLITTENWGWRSKNIYLSSDSLQHQFSLPHLRFYAFTLFTNFLYQSLECIILLIDV